MGYLGGGVLLLVCSYNVSSHTNYTHTRHGSSLRSKVRHGVLSWSSRLQTAPDQHLISRARRFFCVDEPTQTTETRGWCGWDEPWRFPRHGSRHGGTWCRTPQSCTESSSVLHISLTAKHQSAILLSASTFLCSASIGLSRVSMCAYKCPCLLTFLPVTASRLQRWVAPGRWWSNDAWLMKVLAQT